MGMMGGGRLWPVAAALLVRRDCFDDMFELMAAEVRPVPTLQRRVENKSAGAQEASTCC